MRVAIFVDSRYRDTISCLLVEKELRKLRKGWETLVVSIDLWQQAMQLFRPDVVILNHAIGYRNNEIIRRAKYSIVLPTEGRPNTKEQEAWFVGKQDGIADLYLSWNEQIAKMFQKTKAVVTGCPRFDVHHTHRDLIDSKTKARAKYGLDQDKTTIGVFTSFPQAKFSFQNIQFNEHDWKDLGVSEISTRENPLEFAQKEMRERQKFMTAVDAVADEHDWQILVKPHPMEDIIQIQQWCNERGYVCITQDTIFNVVAAVDGVINRVGCITEIDSTLQGVPFISFGKPEDAGEADRDSCYSVSELLEYVDTDWLERSVNADYAKHCGIYGESAPVVARAIVDNVPDIRSDKIDTANYMALQKEIQQHSWQNTVLDLNKGAVGKAATMGYINSWASKI